MLTDQLTRTKRKELRYPLRANSAGWENDPRPQEREELEMTFTYAVIAHGGIVLVADSQITHTHSDHFGVIGTYEGCRGKIKRIGDRFAFSIAGNGGLADTLLAAVDRASVDALPSFKEIVKAYETAMGQELDRLYPGEVPLALVETEFLFCGYIPGFPSPVPQLVKLAAGMRLQQNPITGRDMAATGATRHGAAYYLHHRFYREGMQLEQAKLLAYCAAAEVADQDNSVGGQIEMEIITSEGSRALAEEERGKCEKARQEIISSVRTLVESFQ
jgi:20S proteasome alpha/beta subunit